MNDCIRDQVHALYSLYLSKHVRVSGPKLTSTALLSASSSAVSLNGLKRNDTAPCSNARSRTPRSFCAVIKIIGILRSLSLIAFADRALSCQASRNRESGILSVQGCPRPGTLPPMRMLELQNPIHSTSQAVTRVRTRRHQPPPQAHFRRGPFRSTLWYKNPPNYGAASIVLWFRSTGRVVPTQHLSHSLCRIRAAILLSRRAG